MKMNRLFGSDVTVLSHVATKNRYDTTKTNITITQVSHRTQSTVVVLTDVRTYVTTTLCNAINKHTEQQWVFAVQGLYSLRDHISKLRTLKFQVAAWIRT